MRNHFIVVSALLPGLLAANAYAADYYVAQKDAAAADKNPGTEAKPFKSLLPAVDKVHRRHGVVGRRRLSGCFPGRQGFRRCRGTRRQGRWPTRSARGRWE